MNPRRADHRVLIIAADPLLAALVGALVEGTSLQAAFPRDDEAPEDALTRVRPIAAVLLDAVTDEAASDLFLARARRRRTPVLLFGSAASIRLRLAWAQARMVPAYALPADLEAFQVALEGLLAPEEPRAPLGRRRPAKGVRGSDGRLVFNDAAGTQWTVYDRRAGDRRAPEVERRFVSDGGTVRHCRIAATDADSESVAELSKQLARAIAVEKA